MKMKNLLEKSNAIEMLETYIEEMRMAELSQHTINKYVLDIEQWLYASPVKITKDTIVKYKESLYIKYKATSANSKIASINRYLKWMRYDDLKIKARTICRQGVSNNIIGREQYFRMLEYAYEHNKDKIYLIMKTMAQTGMRISELQYLTVEAIKNGYIEVWNKGKYRNIIFTNSLCRELFGYCIDKDIASGVIFCGRKKGKAITPGAVWKDLKHLAKQTGVPTKVVYPHALRHLFAKEYMKSVGDISELSDLLGHSRIETTMIYTRTSIDEKRRALEFLNL